MRLRAQARMATLGVSLLLGATSISMPESASGNEHTASAPVSQAADDMAEGEVRRVDRETRKITLRHGEIRQLDMPPMTMVFQVKDPALLDMVKPGDKVKFRAEKIGSAYTITEIEAVR